ncbi:VOC family protein [uncultured Jatrophihabitans sp.]|uniref:VOC family protein n=1 Tax=uncultured Jatrophihabitans sp. TaxID=1610747 RepID=UPI0035CA14FA
MTLITRLRSIAISAQDPAALLPFYEQTWGLERVAETTDGAIQLRARGPEHHVFTLVPGDGHSLELISLAASSPDAVDTIVQRARDTGAEVEQRPAASTEPGGGYRAIIRDPEGRRLEVSADLAEHDGAPGRDFGPDRLSHIVLNCTDMTAAKDFYQQVLGFQISDWYENDQMVFLRCNELHHCIVLAPGRWTSLNHVAFEVESADEVMRALGRMRKAGFDTIWGPGRHGPGGNVFCYFIDPVGNVIEYTAELLVLADDWQPHSWVRNQENADVWGTSGGISPEVIAAMANPPAGERS